MKKTAYLTPEIREISMETDELLVYSVNGGGLRVDDTEDDITTGDDNRARCGSGSIWGDE